MIKRYSLALSTCVLAYFCIAQVTQAQVTLKLVSPGNNISNGVYVGPYTLQLNGAGDIQAVCDDRNTDINSSTWNASVNTFATNTINNTKFYGTASIDKNPSNPSVYTTQLQNYEAAAWLVQQMMAVANVPANYTEIADMHLAIWSLFSSTANASLTSNTDAHMWYNKGLSHMNDPTSEFSDVVFYTPSPLSTSQEMMMVTPEPASMMLFGTGLLAIAGIIRRRRPEGKPPI